MYHVYKEWIAAVDELSFLVKEKLVTPMTLLCFLQKI